MKKLTFYQQLSVDEKQRLRVALKEIRALRKKQIDDLERYLMNPLRKAMWSVDEVLRNTKSLNEFQVIQKQMNDHFEGLFKKEVKK